MNQSPNKSHSIDRISNLKKISPKEKTIHRVYLYYASNDNFCKELIKIIMKIPELSRSIKWYIFQIF